MAHYQGSMKAVSFNGKSPDNRDIAEQGNWIFGKGKALVETSSGLADGVVTLTATPTGTLAELLIMYEAG